MPKNEAGMQREDKDFKFHPHDYTTPYCDVRYWSHMKKNEHHGRGNWKKGGMPPEYYLESIERHTACLRLILAGLPVPPELGKPNEDHAAAIRFNANCYMNEEEIEQKQNPPVA